MTAPVLNHEEKERLFDLLIHDVDMCLHLFGLPQAVSAVGYEDLPRGIDWLTARFRYPGVSAVLSGGWHHPRSYPFSMEYTVVSDGGTIEYNSAVTPPTLYGAEGSKEELPLGAEDGYQAEVRYFVECCVRGRPPELCPPAESAAAVKLVRLMLEARDKQGEEIECRF